MKVLIACEYSGIVRDAFAAKGHDAWSCDILPTETKGNHLEGDVLEHLNKGWDLMIAHPPCTYLSNAGARFLYPKGNLNEDRYKLGLKANLHNQERVIDTAVKIRAIPKLSKILG